MHPLKHRCPLQAAAFGLAVISTLAFSGLFTRQPAPRYTVTDLGVLPGDTSSWANAINSRGEVVGNSFLHGGRWRAFLWRGGRMTFLGTLGGLESRAVAISDSGDIAGDSLTLRSQQHAFLFHNGRMEDVSPHDASVSFSYAVDSSGQVCGENYPTKGGHRALFHRNSKASTPPLPSAFTASEPRGMNDRGQIVGKIVGNRIKPQWKAFFFDSRTGQMTTLPVVPPFTKAAALAINNNGQTVGTAWNTNQPSLAEDTQHPGQHAVLWEEGRMTDLGVLPHFSSSSGMGLNNRGQVVGCCSQEPNFLPDAIHRLLNHGTDPSHEEAFLYDTGRMMGLNSLISTRSGWTLETATGINDRGQIVGSGQHDGQQRAFLLTPR